MGSCLTEPKLQRPIKFGLSTRELDEKNFGWFCYCILHPSNINELLDKSNKQQYDKVKSQVFAMCDESTDMKQFRKLFLKLQAFEEVTVMGIFGMLGNNSETLPKVSIFLGLFLFKLANKQTMTRIMFWIYSTTEENRQSIRRKTEFPGQYRKMKRSSLKRFIKQNKQRMIKSLKQNKANPQIKKQFNEKQITYQNFKQLFNNFNWEMFREILQWDENGMEAQLADICEQPIRRKYGTIVYLVEYQWFLQWKKYMKSKYKINIIVEDQDNKRTKSSRIEGKKIQDKPESVVDARPEKIRNQILSGYYPNQLKRNLIEFKDYILLPQSIWKLIELIYRGGPVYRRSFPEIYSMEVLQVYVDEKGRFIPGKLKNQIHISVNNDINLSFREIVQKDPQLKSNRQPVVCFYKYCGKLEWEQVKDLNISIQEILNHQRTYICFVPKSLINSFTEAYNIRQIQSKNSNRRLISNYGLAVAVNEEEQIKKGHVVGILNRGQSIQVELQNSFGSIIRKIIKTQELQKSNLKSIQNGGVHSNSLAGLANLQNTCYINSTIQCLIATPLFGEYLNKETLQKKQQQDSILDQLFNIYQKTRKSTEVIETAKFKKTIDICFPQFKGYSQQDAQQFLLRVLIKLGEEIKEKSESKKSKLRQENAKTKEDNIKIKSPRNSTSKIVSKNAKYFGGISQVETTCKKCNELHSRHEQPFLTFPIGLPQRKEREFYFIFIPKVGNSKYYNKNWTPVKYGLTINSNSSFADIIPEMAKLVNLPKQNLYCIPVSNGEWMREFSESDYQKELVYFDNFGMQIVCYQIQFADQIYRNKSFEGRSLKIEARNRYFRYYSDKKQVLQTFSLPLLIQVSKSTTWQNIEDDINAMCRKSIDEIYLQNKNMREIRKLPQQKKEKVEEDRQSQVMGENEIRRSSRHKKDPIAIGGTDKKIPQKKPSKYVLPESLISQGSNFQQVPLNKKMPEFSQIHQTPDFDFVGVPYQIRLISKSSYSQDRCLLCRQKFTTNQKEEKKQKKKQNFSFFSMWTSTTSCKGCTFSTKKPLLQDPEVDVSNNGGSIVIIMDWNQYFAFKSVMTYDKSCNITKKQKNERKDNIEQILQQSILSEQILSMKCQKIQCSGKQVLRKQTLINFPNILVIHIKRFRFEDNYPVKMMNSVTYPPILKIKMEKYALYAVIVHNGNGLSGHYYSYVNTNSNNGNLGSKWFKCDDERVTEIQTQEYLHPDAYILFYRNIKFQPSLIQLSL